MLLIRLLDTFTNDGNIVIDPFLGSGTTLLAAEETGRVCYGGEVDPIFCSDIISRWEQVTGEKAELIEDADTI
jgi:DNA modification methylase